MSDETPDCAAPDCAQGFHAPPVEQAPVDHGACVNVDHACPACGYVFFVESWTKEAWLAEQAKPPRKRPKKPAGEHV